MDKTTFHLSKMDCSSEETMVRTKLDPFQSIKSLEFDLQNRNLNVYHSNQLKEIKTSLEELNLGLQLIGSEPIADESLPEASKVEYKLLWTVLLINFGFFVIEILTGFVSGSMGLVADSLDMLADASVYGLSLLAVGTTVVRKKQVAKLSGYFQLILAFLGFVEVIRRFIGVDLPPNSQTMIIVSVLALIANSYCLVLFQKNKNKQEAHIKASMIFTSNDIIINSGVILAGVLVFLTQSHIPDLIVGSIVFIVVLRGAFRILKLAK